MEASQTGVSARERWESRRKNGSEAKAAPKPRPKATPRAPSPTRAIEPGIVHYRIAAGALRGLQAKAQEAGLSLDIGDLPEGTTDTTGDTDDPERLVKITAHLIARVADRFSFVRKFSRHMEGAEKRAGLLSDLTAALVELYKRNPDAFEQLGKAYAREIRTQAAARKAEKTSPQHNPTPGGIHATQ